MLLALASQIKTNETPDVISSLIKDFFHLTEGALSKILLDQLISASKSHSESNQWVFTLPYLEDQSTKTIDIKIKQNKGNSRQQDIDNWSVLIRLNPSTLGMITCKLSYNHQLLNANFWCQKNITSQLFKTKIKLLQNQLEQAGIRLGHLSINQGVLEEHYDLSSFDGQLLNETA